MNIKKDEAAVSLGQRGGRKTHELYGKSHFQDMARLSHISRWGAGDKLPLAKKGKGSKVKSKVE